MRIFFNVLTIMLFALPYNVNAQVDTTYKFYDENWKECNKDSAYYYSKVFVEANSWHRQDFYVSNNQIQMDGYGEDSTVSKRKGSFKYYYISGSLKSETLYSNYRKKSSTMYYENGQKKYSASYDTTGYEMDEQSWMPDGSQNASYTAYRPIRFKEGKSAWIKFLMKNLNVDIPYKNGAPIGKYTVTISFVVSSSGELKNVFAENDPGYGTADEAVRVMKKSSKHWTPLIEDNKIQEKAELRKFTFVVNEQ
ncbi:MAG: hypothetical protein DI598_02600 [Pseudopedobacter saltans]|uniref:TonB C-terminal domain-containing protein n=1 Tax=Pseudopedobacter saltans TaxID=151895 RepID=A0A2W5FDI9_9SPHI|nr:MAG: hypothetical protein DI598_02600 [Pseudopedobacter saltans]